MIPAQKPKQILVIFINLLWTAETTASSTQAKTNDRTGRLQNIELTNVSAVAGSYSKERLARRFGLLPALFLPKVRTGETLVPLPDGDHFFAYLPGRQNSFDWLCHERAGDFSKSGLTSTAARARQFGVPMKAAAVSAAIGLGSRCPSERQK